MGHILWVSMLLFQSNKTGLFYIPKDLESIQQNNSVFSLFLCFFRYLYAQNLPEITWQGKACENREPKKDSCWNYANCI